MKTMFDRISERLQRTGQSASGASKAAGFSPGFIYDIERRGAKPSYEKLVKLADALGTSADFLIHGKDVSKEHEIDELKVFGIVSAGSWRDISLIDDEENIRTIPVARDARFPNARQYALEVHGDSMNRRFLSKSFVTCVDWGDAGISLRPKLCLHIERIELGSRVECTVKVYAERDGKRWLEPDSTNPNHKPIEINGNEDIEINIKGLVTGSWTPMEI